MTRRDVTQPGSDILTLVAGLENGLVLRLTVDSLTGAISDQRLKYIGPRTVKVERVILVDGDTDESSRVSREAVIAMCTRPWLVHGVNGRILAGPLHYDRLSCCQPFSSDQMVGGFVGAVDNELRIFGITSRLGGDLFAQKVITKCDFTPRHIVSLPSPPLFRQDGTLEPGSSVVSEESPLMLAVIESEHNSYDVETKNEIRAALGQITLTENEDTISTDESQIGTFQAGDGKWASCVKIIHPATGETMSCYPLALDEAAVSACLVYFLEFQEQPCLVVGTIFGMTLRPRSVPMASLKVFAYDSKYELTLLHSTPVEDIPTALCPFQGRLLVGVGNRIRLLSLGKKKLLRKSEFRPLPEECVLIQCYGDRIFLGDVKEGILVLKYFPKESRFRVLCDSSHPSWVTCACLLDYNTIMAADKFGNVYVNRVTKEARADELGEEAASLMRGDAAYATGQIHKMEQIAHYFVGELVTSLEKTTLTPGGAEVVLYSTIMGSVGAFLPISTKDEVDFLQHLEMVMRDEWRPLCGRDHLAFRSYYSPVDHVIDGDLCEQFNELPEELQVSIAQRLDRGPMEILRKVEEIHHRVL